MSSLRNQASEELFEILTTLHTGDVGSPMKSYWMNDRQNVVPESPTPTGKIPFHTV
jgi:hypothetical protein